MPSKSSPSARTTLPVFLRNNINNNNNKSYYTTLTKRTRHIVHNIQYKFTRHLRTILYTTSLVGITALLYTAYNNITWYTHNNNIIQPQQQSSNTIHTITNNVQYNHNNNNNNKNKNYTIINDSNTQNANYIPQPVLPQTIVLNHVNTYPHDSNAFTQGLQYHNNILYESTGLYGQSQLRIVDIYTGKILQSVNLPHDIFGEGLTIVPDKHNTDNYYIYVLSWNEKRCLVYNKNLQLTHEYKYDTSGWGITYNKHNNTLIMSDGSNKLYIIDSYTFELLHTVDVRIYDSNKQQYVSVTYLNELEYINNYVYANVWLTDRIVMIDIQTGIVHRILTLNDHIRSNQYKNNNRDAVCNGIAYDDIQRRLFITGKLWNTLYQVDYVPDH